MKKLIILISMVFCLVLAVAAIGSSQEDQTVTSAPEEQTVTSIQEEQAAAPGQQEQTAVSSISVEEAAICRDVVDRTPVEPGDVFPVGVEKLFCHTRIVGVEGEAEITHNWYYGENLVASVALPVRSTNWRTFSSKKITAESTGEWRVEVVDGSGVVLKKIIFLVQ